MEPADSTVSTSMWRIGQPASVWIRSVLPVIVPLTILVEDEYWWKTNTGSETSNETSTREKRGYSRGLGGGLAALAV